MSPSDRFHSQYEFEPNTGCWLWSRGLSPGGYGNYWENGKTRTASRVSWERHIGEIPSGKMVLHKCDVRACVNPDHLFLGDAQANMTDKAQKGRCNTPYGEAVKNSKLTAEQAIAIRRDKRRLQPIADEYGVTIGLVSAIRLGKLWRHLGGNK